MAGAGSVGPISLSTRCVMRPRSAVAAPCMPMAPPIEVPIQRTPDRPSRSSSSHASVA
ncbi:Uncharacterised protein [Bordetella pertussis]|nr:Uncharacterised protein [Bordetella pertussis]